MTVWIVLVVISVIVLAAEAVLILPDKMPWNRKKGEYNDQSVRSDR